VKDKAMRLKLDVWFPCASLFARGRIALGLLALVMQMSLIFWPLASKWARGSADQSNVERMLAELSEANRVPVDPYAQPLKRFRQAA
jgi:hypothetical protein